MRASPRSFARYDAEIKLLAAGHLPALVLLLFACVTSAMSALWLGGYFIAVQLSFLAIALATRKRRLVLPESEPARLQVDGTIRVASGPDLRIGPRSFLLPNTLFLQVLGEGRQCCWRLARKANCPPEAWRRLKVLWLLLDSQARQG